MVKHTSGCLAGLLEQVRGQNSVQVCPAGARPRKKIGRSSFSLTVRTAESLALLETKLAYSAPRPLGSRGLIWGISKFESFVLPGTCNSPRVVNSHDLPYGSCIDMREIVGLLSVPGGTGQPFPLEKRLITGCFFVSSTNVARN